MTLQIPYILSPNLCGFKIFFRHIFTLSSKSYFGTFGNLYNFIKRLTRTPHLYVSAFTVEIDKEYRRYSFGVFIQI